MIATCEVRELGHLYTHCHQSVAEGCFQPVWQRGLLQPEKDFSEMREDDNSVNVDCDLQHVFQTQS